MHSFSTATVERVPELCWHRRGVQYEIRVGFAWEVGLDIGIVDTVDFIG